MARSAVTKGRLQKVGAEVGVSGVEEIKANIAGKLDKFLGMAAKQVFMKAAMIAVKEIKDLAPVKSGKLRDAIFADYGDPKKPNVLVGVNYKKAPHGHLAEFKNHGGDQPFFRPGITATRAPMAVVIVEGLRDLAEND
jgi:hypothetical protein